MEFSAKFLQFWLQIEKRLSTCKLFANHQSDSLPDGNSSETLWSGEITLDALTQERGAIALEPH